MHPLKTAAQLAEHCLCGRAKNRNDRNGNDDEDEGGGGGGGDDNGDMNDNVMIMMTIIRTSHNLSTPFILLLGGD